MELRILVPVDGSKTAQRTIAALVEAKERFIAPLTLLHVVDLERLAYRMIPDFQVAMIRDHARKAGELLLEGHAASLRQAGLQVEPRLEFGYPREAIRRIANDEDFGLVILGRRGMGEIRDVLFGTVSNYLLHHVQKPVLLI